jgi:hypothetical protein
MSLGDQRFVFVDVAGQRSEKKRWMHYFEDVRAVLFVASLSDFDVTVAASNDAPSTNALRLAIELFHGVARSTWFPHSALLLCLNKRDLFKDKLAQGRLLKQALPNYAGSSEEDALAAVSSAFTEPLGDIGKRVTMFTCCAVEAESVRSLFGQVKEHVLQSTPHHTL